MAINTWLQQPNGTFKNHEMSAKLRDEGIARNVFMPFVPVEPGYGRKKGETLTITRFKQLSVPTNARLTEGTPVPSEALQITTQSVTISEWGRQVKYTSLMEDLSHYDVRNKVQQQLMTQMSRVLDIAIADVSKKGQIKYVPVGVAQRNITTNGTASGTAQSNLNVFHVEEIRDYLTGTLFAEPFEDGNYVAIVNWKAMRGLRSDPAFTQYRSHTGKRESPNDGIVFEGIRFIETNHTAALGLSGQGNILGEGLFFGKDALGMIEVEAPHLVAGVALDLGREQPVGWLGTMEFFQVYGDSGNAGEARLVHVTSA